MTNSADRAKDHMNKVGMAKGVAANLADGSVCMVGALNALLMYGQIKRGPDFTTTMITCHKVIREQFGDRSPTGSIPIFNDHPDTTLDDVNMVWEKTSILLDEMV